MNVLGQDNSGFLMLDCAYIDFVAGPDSNRFFEWHSNWSPSVPMGLSLQLLEFDYTFVSTSSLGSIIVLVNLKSCFWYYKTLPRNEFECLSFTYIKFIVSCLTQTVIVNNLIQKKFRRIETRIMEFFLNKFSLISIEQQPGIYGLCNWSRENRWRIKLTVRIYSNYIRQLFKSICWIPERDDMILLVSRGGSMLHESEWSWLCLTCSLAQIYLISFSCLSRWKMVQP